MSTTETQLREPHPLQDRRPQLKIAEPPMPQERPAPQVSPEAGKSKAKRFSVRKLGLGVALVAALAASGWYGYDWYMVGRFMVSTDDAYVRADMSTLTAKVAGYVAELPVKENTLVKAGTVILKLDDGDFLLAVASAKDRIDLQNATIARISEQVKAQDATIQSSQAKVAMAQADATNLQGIYERQQALVKKDFASTQALDQARANRDRADAAVTSAQADLAAAQAQRDVPRSTKPRRP